MTHVRVVSAATCLLVAVTAGLVTLLRSRRKKPDREKLRREWLSRIGRVTIGTALDVQEALDERKKEVVHLLIYRYDIAGVAYEASQDITHLQEIFDKISCRLGLPASIKYDPQNPGNSIVVSETWNGLRK
jgi:hypothetical protein